MNNRIKIRLRYWKLLREIEGMGIYDGRGKGVDVYVCKGCGRTTLTRYKDKGVTPFTMICRCCGGTATHENTLPEADARMLSMILNVPILNWVRPPLRALLDKNARYVEHVLDGGLVLESDVMATETNFKD